MRKCNRSTGRWTALLTATSAVALPALALADTSITQFQPGDFLIMRAGDAANPNGTTNDPDSGGEVNAYIDEYSQAGYYVGTIPLPAMTLPGFDAWSHEGNLDISPSGQWVAFAGYQNGQNIGDSTVYSPVGVNAHATDGTENAVLGEINLAAGPSSLNTSTVIPGTPLEQPNNVISGNSLTGQFVHSAMTVDGNEFYVGGKYSLKGNQGGLQTNDTGLLYVNGVGASTTDTVLEGGTDWRNILAFNGQLYGATGSSAVGVHGAYTIGTGIYNIPAGNETPPLSHTEITNYSGGQSASSLSLGDVNTSDSAAGTSNGYNVLYTIGDQSVPGITKYYYDPVNQVWQHAGSQVPLNNNNINDPVDIVAAPDPTNSSWIDLTVSGWNGIYTYIDKSGDPEAALPANAFNVQITPPSYASFYGMTQVPNQTTNVAPVNLVWGNTGNGSNWDVGASSNWTYAGGNVKFAQAENVTFADTSNNTGPITLSTTVQPASITVEASKNNYTISGTGSIAGSGSVRLLPGNTSTFTLATPNTYTGGTIVSGGVLKILPTNPTTSALGTGSLTINNNGLVQLAPNVTLGSQTGPAPKSNVNITALSITGNGTLDINNNHLIIDYASGPDPISSIAALITSGYNGGTWTGVGITSSAAAITPGYGVGYADSADTGNPAGLSSGTIEVKYTLLGDANLDGTVNGIDFGILAANFNKGVTGWDKGDFNYDNVVSGIDFGDLAANFNKGASGAALGAPAYDDPAILAFAAANGLLADVPEPASIGILAIGAVSLAARRRRGAK